MRNLLPILLLSGCQFVPGTEASAIKKAESAVASTLSDPGSAQFRSESVPQPGLVCGEINAKNSFGGYVGYRPFAYSVANNGVYLPSEEGAPQPATAICVGNGTSSLCCNGTKFPIKKA